MEKRSSYFFRSLLVTMLVVAVPLTVLLAYSLLAQRRDDLNAAKTTLHARVQQTAQAADNALGRVQQILGFLATRPELQNGDSKACLAFLRDLSTIDPLLANVAVVDLQGEALCRSVEGAGTSSFAHRDWFREAVGADGDRISLPYKGMLTQRWQLTVTRPLRNAKGERVALLAAALDVETLSRRLLPSTGLPPGSVLGLVTGDGTVMAINRENEDWIGRRLPADLFGRLMGAAGAPAEAAGLDGSSRVLATAALQHFGLHAGVGVARDTVMAASETRARHSAAIALLIVAMAFMLAWFGARRLSRPVRSLADTARQLGTGDLDARADESLPGEFRLLAHEFNKAITAVRASADARRAQAAAEAASEAKSEFLANMSHEIRTPMNAIIGMTDLAMREPVSPKLRGYLTKVHLAAHNLLGIVNDILDFSKIEAGKLDIERTEFALQAVLDRVTTLIGVQAQKKGQELLISRSADVPEFVIGDPLRLEQVLVNLCTNAVKFTEPGGIVLVSIRNAGDGQLRFAVRDTGPGMTEEQVSQLFTPFNQLDASTTRKHGGTGLGLAICRRLVGLMGGEIDVRSQLGKGSEFFFTVKLDAAAAAQAAPAPTIDLAGCRVLVVDDNAEARDIFMDELTRLSARVEHAADGAEALHRLRGEPEGYDVVLVDLKLPDVDGFSLVKRMRDAGGAASRYLLVTAFGDDDVSMRAQAEGLDGCLFKPVSRESLVKALDLALCGSGGKLVDGPARALAHAALRGARVLLVEDNEFNQIVASELLGTVAGMLVTIADSGPEALAALQESAFDIVLMDVQMPGMDGFEVTYALRSKPEHVNLPIIAMTAYAMERDRQRCLAAGMNDFVTKPVEPAELFAVLARWLEPRLPHSAKVAASPPERHVDVEEGRRRCLGRKDLYDRIVERFLSSCADDGKQLLHAIETGDMAVLERIAHTTTSTAGTLGARRLSEIARELQASMRNGGTGKATHSLATAFEAELRDVTLELVQLGENSTPGTGS